jgi:threonine dehydratase
MAMMAEPATAPNPPDLPDFQDISLARKRIAPYARRTPLIESRALSERAGTSVYLKLENLQETGSFKVRGAANKLLALSSEEQARGVVTVSSGNHGRALAFVANRLGLRAIVVVSSRVPEAKKGPIAALGAELVVHGDSYDEAEAHSRTLERELGLTKIYPDDDPFIIAGQGTIGLELLEALPFVDSVVVPIGGGGLISGIATAVKSADRSVRAIGVSMARAPVMIESLKAGRPVEMEELATLADGLAGGIGLGNRYTFRACQALVDQTVVVTEDEIAAAMVFAAEEHRLIVEGAGAVGIAALLAGKVSGAGQQLAVVISGGNVDLSVLAETSRELREVCPGISRAGSF